MPSRSKNGRSAAGPIAAPAAGAPAQEFAATRARAGSPPYDNRGDAIAMMPFVRPVVILAAGASEAGIRLEELL